MWWSRASDMDGGIRAVPPRRVGPAGRPSAVAGPGPGPRPAAAGQGCMGPASGHAYACHDAHKDRGLGN